MDSNTRHETHQRMPVAILVALAIAAMVIAYVVLMASTAVAASEAAFLEWIFSALIVGWLTLRASYGARYGHGMKVVIASGVTLAYFLARILLAMIAGPA